MEVEPLSEYLLRHRRLRDERHFALECENRQLQTEVTRTEKIIKAAIRYRDNLRKIGLRPTEYSKQLSG